MEALIKSGAMDGFCDNRAALSNHLEFSLQSADQRQKNIDAGMIDMFAEVTEESDDVPIPDGDYWDEKLRLNNEKESLGLYLSGHPLDIVNSEIRQIVSLNLAQWLEKARYR